MGMATYGLSWTETWVFLERWAEVATFLEIQEKSGRVKNG